MRTLANVHVLIRVKMSWLDSELPENGLHGRNLEQLINKYTINQDGSSKIISNNMNIKKSFDLSPSP
jgi:hypothetical protein